MEMIDADGKGSVENNRNKVFHNFYEHLSIKVVLLFAVSIAVSSDDS